MFEVYSMSPYAREIAIINKEYEVGMMEAAYMETLLDNKLALNKARAELKVMTESTKEYAVGDLVYMYNEAAKEVANQGQGLFTKIKNTVVTWFVKIWNTIQKVFTKQNTEAYEALKRSNKKFKFSFNPKKYADDATKVADSISQIPDTITNDIKSDNIGTKILAAVGITVAAGGVFAAIKNFGPKNEETIVSAQEAPTIVDTITKAFGKITGKIKGIKTVQDSTTGTQPATQSGANGTQDNNSQGEQNDQNQNNSNGSAEKEGVNILKMLKEFGAGILNTLNSIREKFGLTGGKDVDEEDAKLVKDGEEEETSEKAPAEAPPNGKTGQEEPTNGGGEAPTNTGSEEPKDTGGEGKKTEEGKPNGGSQDGDETGDKDPKKVEENISKDKAMSKTEVSGIAMAIIDNKGYKNWTTKYKDAPKLQSAVKKLSELNHKIDELSSSDVKKMEDLIKEVVSYSRGNLKIGHDDENGYYLQRKDGNKWVKEFTTETIPGKYFTESEMELLNSL